MSAFPERATSLPAFVGNGKEQKEVIIDFRNGLERVPHDHGIGGEFARAGHRPDQNETSHALGIAKREGLSDVAADRKSKDIDRRKLKSPRETSHMVSHGFDSIGRFYKTMGFRGGRTRDRTLDLSRVKGTLSR